jgi:formamidopyrimidine-DNA glycosylase
MPELPEVETTVRDLRKKALGCKIVDIWTDWPKMIKRPKNFGTFKKEIKGRKIKKAERKGKNILFELAGNKTLLIHQKLTGHLLLGNWQKENKGWKPQRPGPLEDPMNRFLHLIFWLDNGEQLALSDLRKFAKVELLDKKELQKKLSSLGPEPLAKDFTLEKFKDCLRNKKGKVKQILMDQQAIAGIGNIYSDEILWQAKIHPFRNVSKLTQPDLKRIYQAIKKILKKAIELRGESISDFRDLEGERGRFDEARKVYRREGEKCSNCGIKIKRVKLAGRSAHFCPKCQLLI